MTSNLIQTGGRNETQIDLEACLFQVEASKAWFHDRVLPLSIGQLRWRPDPWHWSIAECLDHLNITLDLYLPRIADAAAHGRRRAGDGHGSYRQIELEALELMEPPVLLPAPAPPPALPAAAIDPDRLVDRFHQLRDRYADAVRRADGLDLPRIEIEESIYPMVHSLGATLALLAAHDRRHMWQAERVRQNPRFPRVTF